MEHSGVAERGRVAAGGGVTAEGRTGPDRASDPVQRRLDARYRVVAIVAAALPLVLGALFALEALAVGGNRILSSTTTSLLAVGISLVNLGYVLSVRWLQRSWFRMALGGQTRAALRMIDLPFFADLMRTDPGGRRARVLLRRQLRWLPRRSQDEVLLVLRASAPWCATQPAPVFRPPEPRIAWTNRLAARLGVRERTAVFGVGIAVCSALMLVVFAAMIAVPLLVVQEVVSMPAAGIAAGAVFGVALALAYVLSHVLNEWQLSAGPEAAYRELGGTPEAVLAAGGAEFAAAVAAAATAQGADAALRVVDARFRRLPVAARVAVVRAAREG